MPFLQISQVTLLMNQIGISGSLIGTLADTQEVIDFCAKHNIVPNTELITWKQLDKTYDTLRQSNDKVVRYVLDIEESKKSMDKK